MPMRLCSQIYSRHEDQRNPPIKEILSDWDGCQVSEFLKVKFLGVKQILKLASVLGTRAHFCPSNK